MTTGNNTKKYTENYKKTSPAPCAELTVGAEGVEPPTLCL